MENTKKTKAMYFTELREIILNTIMEQDDQDELIEFIDKQLETLEKRRIAAASRAEKKRSESDAMTEAVLSQVGEELVTVDDIVAALDSEDVTRNKVTARLGKLVKAGVIVKEAVRVDGNKRMAYRLATDAE